MIVVIGGAGFLGRHLVSRLSGQVPVTIVARSIDETFLRDFAPDARPMTLEVFEGPDGDALLKAATATVWLAGATVPSSNASEPWNELGQTLNPLWRGVDRILRANPAARFVFPSSGGAVYGRGYDRPTPEDAPLKPISAYGFGKVMAEHVVQWSASRVGADYAILRISNPVGRWQRDGRQGIAGVALRALNEGRPLTLFDHGRQIRDFFDADDMADLFRTVATWPTPLRGVWNAGSGRAVAVGDLVALLARKFGREPNVVLADRRPEDLDYAVVDPGRAALDFGWRAETPLEETIDRMVAASRDAG